MRSNRITSLINSIFLALYVIMAGFCTYIVRYIVPSADDYSNSLDIRHYMDDLGYGRLSAVWAMVREGYLKNQGTWFSSILDFLPLSFREIYSYGALRAYMIVADVFLFVSVAFFVYWFCRRYLDRQYWGLALLLTSFCALNHASPSETLLWMNGACVYTIPLACAFMAVGAFVAYLDNKEQTGRSGYIIPTIVFGILATGGNLTIAGFLCAVVTSLVLCEWMTGRGNRAMFIVPVICVAGSLVNALAPGNFNRHERYSAYGTLTIADSLVNTVVIIHHRVVELMTHSFLIATVIGIAVLCLIVREGGKRLTNPLIVAICGYGCIYATFFPMVLGYNMDPTGYVIAPRMAFTTGWIIVLVFAFVTAYIMLWIRDILHRAESRADQENDTGQESGSLDDEILSEPTGLRRTFWWRELVVFVCIAILFAVNFAFLYDPVESDMYLFTMVRELRSGTLEETYTAQRKVLDEIKSADRFAVVTIENYVPASRILKHLDLTEDPEWWVNVATGQFYDYKTVIYVSPVGE